MVITIDGIQKMKGHLFCGREIVEVKSDRFFDSHHYIFHFDSLPNCSNPYGCWENEFNVHLAREDRNGLYELYVMGLHGVTCHSLHLSEIQNFQTFYSYFEKVVRLSKQYWDENK